MNTERDSDRTARPSVFKSASTLPLGLALGLMWTLAGAVPARGHGAIADVTHTLTITATYETGEPMAEAQVLVYSPRDGGTPWKVDQTNAQGEYQFTPDTDGSWEVIIRQAGHGKAVTIPVGTASSGGGGGLSRAAGIAVGLWGLLGTALFFSRGKKS